jgi:hypothetical protein
VFALLTRAGQETGVESVCNGTAASCIQSKSVRIHQRASEQHAQAELNSNKRKLKRAVQRGRYHKLDQLMSTDFEDTAVSDSTPAALRTILKEIKVPMELLNQQVPVKIGGELSCE